MIHILIMDNSLTISQILSQFMKLNLNDRKTLLDKLKKLMTNSKNEVNEPTEGLSALDGLGAEIWREVDIDSYLNNERKWD